MYAVSVTLYSTVLYFYYAELPYGAFPADKHPISAVLQAAFMSLNYLRGFMEIIIEKVENELQQREFIDLPYTINAGRKIFTPPLRESELAFHDEDLNPRLKESDQVRFLALMDGNYAGRIMGVIYHPSNEKKGKKVARFCKLDHIMDAAVGVRLMEPLEQWARDQGAAELIGPFEFDQLGKKGLLTGGIDVMPAWNASYEDPYVAACLLGPDKEMWFDFFSYQVPVPEKDPEHLIAITERIRSRGSFKVISFRSKEEIHPYIDQITAVYNNNCDTEYGFMPVTKEEIKEIIDAELPFTDTRFIKLVTASDGTPAAFVLAHRCVADTLKRRSESPSWISRVFKKNDQPVTNRADIFTGAVDHRFRGMGIEVLLALELFRECRSHAIPTIDSNLIYESNGLTRRMFKKLGGDYARTYRVFGKKLD